MARAPDALKILPGLSVYVGRTASEADELYEELQSLISPALGLSYLSKIEKQFGVPVTTRNWNTILKAIA